MKIAVMLTRPWSAIHRFRSFLINARRLGHELFCMGPRAFTPNTYDLTKLALADLDLDLLPISARGPYIDDQYDLSALEPTLDRIDPDVVLGEWAINVPFEQAAQGWAQKRQKLGLILDHVLALHDFESGTLQVKQVAPNSIVLTSNESRDEKCRNAELQTIIVGLPELDLIRDGYDIDTIRKELGAHNDQPLLILFDAFADFRSNPKEVPKGDLTVMTRTLSFLRHARGMNWRVVVHLHPAERGQKDSEGPEALTFTWRYPFLKAMQDLGALFIDDVAPGKIGELNFQYCDHFKAIAASSLAVGVAAEVSDRIYVMGRWYVSLMELSSLHQGKNWPNILIDTTTDFSIVSKTIQRLTFQPDPAFLEKWFYKVDGQTWRRILNLMEELHEKPQNEYSITHISTPSSDSTGS